MVITIETIPHQKQRYNTCGDWQYDEKGNLTIRVSETPRTGPSGSLLIGVHELVEAILCQARGITTQMVDDFDLSYDPKTEIEPGDHPECPCRREHCIAMGIERTLAAILGVEWAAYEGELDWLTEIYKHD